MAAACIREDAGNRIRLIVLPFYISMTIKDYIWTVPFLSFLLGYQLISLLVSVDTIKTPVLVGRSLPEALRELSDHNINARLLAEKPDSDLPEATVLAQTPDGGTKIKPRQNVFLVVSKRPPAEIAPSFIGLTQEACFQKAQEMKMRLKVFHLESHFPVGKCFTQLPAAGQELENKTILIYISQPESHLVILPNFAEKPLSEARAFIESYGLEVEIGNHNFQEQELDESVVLVGDQKPRAGSLIDMQKKLTIRLYAV